MQACGIRWYSVILVIITAPLLKHILKSHIKPFHSRPNESPSHGACRPEPAVHWVTVSARARPE